MDGRLVEAARTGGAALEALIAAIWPDAYRIARTILRDPGHAEDAAQEACARVARMLPSLKNVDAFSSWCYRIVVNEAIACARSLRPAIALDAIADRCVAFDRSDALDLYDALGTLSPVQRAIVILHYHCGFSSKEIAATLGSAPPTVRFHLMMARQALRKALALDPPPNAKEVPSDAH